MGKLWRETRCRAKKVKAKSENDVTLSRCSPNSNLTLSDNVLSCMTHEHVLSELKCRINSFDIRKLRHAPYFIAVTGHGKSLPTETDR